ncbi:MAG: phosphate ABC transporter substrate-binding protein PstS [Candidatus Adiutrix sp.]|jgi:phosphate transport system substrate-binding protein|nr:phosphate ABC transporter substrate-binding protein PstS [Candidatus Adiutrix sp.]
MLKNFAAWLLAALLLTPSLAGAQDVTGAGASFPYPIYSTWAYAYEKAAGSKVNYQSIGSGGGLQQVIAGTVDFGASDDPLTSEQLKAEQLMQFPAVLGGVVPVVNLEGFEANELVLSGRLLADIFQGQITRWNDPAIAELNRGRNLPDGSINVVYRSDSSGTSAIFTNYLSEMSPDWKSQIGAGKSINWPVGVGAKGNDGVAGNVKRVKNSLGYVEYAYAEQNRIAWSSLINAAGQVVRPSLESFSAAAANAAWDRKADYYLWLVNARGEKSWPIAAATFILIKRDKPETIAKVTRFFDWCFKNGDQAAEELQYVPLPDSLKEDIRAYWR